MPSSDRSALPSRGLRTLPWLAGLLIGATAHIVWWSRPEPPPAAPQIAAPVASPPVHIHLHPGEGADPSAAPPPPEPAVRATPTLSTAARGAVVCSSRGCTIRRSFVRKVLDDPSMLSQRPWSMELGPDGLTPLVVQGVFPGSVADVLGLRNGDAIVAVDGQPLRLPQMRSTLDTIFDTADGFTVTVRRHDVLDTIHYGLGDG